MEQADLQSLDKDNLILEQSKMIAQLQADNERLLKALGQLQADYEALKMKFEHNQKPPTTSRNSSQPPSKDQKGNTPKDKRKHRHGPPKGHEKHERQMVAQADHVIELRTRRCQKCQADLRNEVGRLSRINQITELPNSKAQVIEVRQYEQNCPCCGQKQVVEPPAGLEMERSFGSRLEATVVYYRQEQHMSYQRTEKALYDLHGVEISQGGIDEIMKRTGRQAAAKAPAIQETVQQSAVIYCDETGSRVEGDNWWEWVFCTTQAILHIIRFNRSVDVIQDVMGSTQAEVWVSDCLLAQLKAPASQRQVCMAHQLRNLQAVVDAFPQEGWPRRMQTLFRSAIHLHHQRAQLPPNEFAARVMRVERLCDLLLGASPAPPPAQKLLRRYQKYREHLFVFLHRNDVEPTNNVAERALRPSVIHRKVMGCFRSGWGARTYAALASIIDTAELSGISAFTAIQSLLAPPALPLPICGE